MKKYEFFKNSASPKRILAVAEKTHAKYQYCLILPWTKEKTLERESMFIFFLGKDES